MCFPHLFSLGNKVVSFFWTEQKVTWYSDCYAFVSAERDNSRAQKLGAISTMVFAHKTFSFVSRLFLPLCNGFGKSLQETSPTHKKVIFCACLSCQWFLGRPAESGAAILVFTHLVVRHKWTSTLQAAESILGRWTMTTGILHWKERQKLS